MRIPAIVVSSYVEPGTVFRASPGEAPYDHTSTLATLRDWLNLAAEPTKFLPSPRITSAPTLDRVLTRAKGNENSAWPEISPKCAIDGSDVSPNTPLNDVQKSLIVAAAVTKPGAEHMPIVKEVKKFKTYAHGAEYLEARTRQT